MRLKEFLKYSSTLPYNSSVLHLPDYYKHDPKYGLDCFGFVRLLQTYFPQAETILGTYAQGYIHQVAKLDGKFVDPFLRAKDAVALSTEVKSVDTYYNSSSLSVWTDGSDKITAELRRKNVLFGYKVMNTYFFDLKNQESVRDNDIYRIYKYVFLHNGNPVSIVRINNGVEVIGLDRDSCNKIIKSRFNLNIEDIEQMFIDAGQNALYSRHWSG